MPIKKYPLYDPLGREKKKKKKKEVKPAEPAPPTETPIFRGPEGRPTGFTTPTGETYFGSLSPEEEERIKARFAPEQARVAERAETAEEARARVERKKTVAELEVPPEELPPEERALHPLAAALLPEFAEERARGLLAEPPAEGEMIKGTLPIGVGGIGKILKLGKGLELPISRAAQTTRAVQKTITTKTEAGVNQAGILARLWSTKTGKAILAGGVSQGFLEAYATALDSANMQMKEGISEGIVASVRNGAYSPMKGMAMIREVEDNVNENERTIKTLGIFSLRARFLAKFEPIYKRIGKIRIEIAEADQNIRLVAANPVPPNVEELAMITDELGGSE